MNISRVSNILLFGLLALCTAHVLSARTRENRHRENRDVVPEKKPACLREDKDPCIEDNYNILRDPTRSTGYEGSDGYMNDYTLDSGWYRYISPTGTDMPTTAPGIGQCNAFTPIWLDGELPTTEVGIVKKRVCVSHYTGECIRSHLICVKNCGMFNVYHLYTTAGDTDRYCFGKESPCPKGQSSVTGYTPGCRDVTEIFTKNPTLTYEVRNVPVDEKKGEDGYCMGTVFYQCNIDHHDKTQAVSVEWLINGMPFKKPQMMTVDDLPAELSTQDIIKSKAVKKYGFQVGCRLTPIDDDDDTMIGIPKTAEFYAGYNVSQKVLEVREGGDPAHYVVDFTVPCLCLHRCKHTSTPCKLSMNVEVPFKKGQRKTMQCPNGDDQIVFKRAKADETAGFCTTPVDTITNGKNTQFRLPVHARIDGKYDGQKQLALQVGTPMGTQDPLCQNIHFPTATVVVKDEDVSIKGKSCRFYNDPHAKTFDGRLYEMQLEGFFTLYRHTQFPIQVEGYFKNRGRYSQVCGAAIRCGGDMYVINYCGGKKQIAYSKLYECELDKAGVKCMRVIQRGKNYEILLSSGGKVIVTPSTIDIIPSLADVHKTEGLCGLLNGKTNDDFLIKGTNKQDSGKYPYKFANSWRILDKKSLFYGKITDERKFGDVIFCGCDIPERATCGYTENLENCISPTRGNDITENLRRMCRVSKRQAEEGSDALDDSDDMIFEFDINLQPPQTDDWINGWTEVKAREFCENFYKSDSITLCEEMPGVDLVKSIATCIEDIRLTGTTDHAIVQTELIISSCVNEVEKNVTLSEEMASDNDGNELSMAAMLLGQLCPSDCSGQGQCVNGTCHCFDNFSDIDCSVNASRPPELLPLPYHGLCDLSIRPCQAAVVHGDEFVESQQLTCQTQLISDNNELTGEKQINIAQFEHYQKVICPIPTNKYKTEPYVVSIAVSNDGQTYSQPKTIKVYDSRQWSCNQDHNCVKVTNSGSLTSTRMIHTILYSAITILMAFL